MNDKMQELTPAQVVKELDKYIIGQEDAKRNIAIAFRERWRRKHADKSITPEILPNNILMKGATGTGKTEIARRLAKISGIPFVKVEATMYTEKGYVGGDVNDMIVRLSQKAMDMVTEEREEAVRTKAEEKVTTQLLDILIPPITEPNDTEAKSLNRGTRARFLTKIESGELDERLIEISVHEKSAQMVGGMSEDSNIIVFQDLISRMVPRRKKKKKMPLAQARKLLIKQEVESMLETEMEGLKEKARELAENGIVFLDELDKIASTSVKTNGPDVSREGVQRNLLPIIEGCVVNTRIGPVNTSGILFIGAGAFHTSSVSDLMPELLGRLPIRVNFHNLTEEHFYHILKVPKTSILKQQKALFKAEGVDIEFSEGAIESIAKAAYTLNQEREDINARRLSTVIMQVLHEYVFDVPDKIKSGSHIKIDRKIVDEKLKKLLAQKESSRYIL